jgi:hypothetical protein
MSNMIVAAYIYALARCAGRITDGRKGRNDELVSILWTKLTGNHTSVADQN